MAGSSRDAFVAIFSVLRLRLGRRHPLQSTSDLRVDCTRANLLPLVLWRRFRQAGESSEWVAAAAAADGAQQAAAQVRIGATKESGQVGCVCAVRRRHIRHFSAAGNCFELELRRRRHENESPFRRLAQQLDATIRQVSRSHFRLWPAKASRRRRTILFGWRRRRALQWRAPCACRRLTVGAASASRAE